MVKSSFQYLTTNWKIILRENRNKRRREKAEDKISVKAGEMAELAGLEECRSPSGSFEEPGRAVTLEIVIAVFRVTVSYRAENAVDYPYTAIAKPTLPFKGV